MSNAQVLARRRAAAGECRQPDARPVLHFRSLSEVVHGMDDAQVDIALLSRVADRDATAVAALYDRHSRLLFGLILRILRDRGEAEEVLQEVFVRAWVRADTYDAAQGSPAAWLVGIARHRAIDRLRGNDARFRAVQQAPLPPATESPEARAGSSERERAVAQALDALPADQRVLIEEAYFLGLTQSELAGRHRLPLGTVKGRIRAGMLALRDRLAQT